MCRAACVNFFLVKPLLLLDVVLLTLELHNLRVLMLRLVHSNVLASEAILLVELYLNLLYRPLSLHLLLI